MKVIGITIFTNPDYRQDPARECVRQILEVCDEVVVVFGAESDRGIIRQLQNEYPDRIVAEYLEWKQPEWTMDELPKHLNRALEIARERGCDWIIKFDSDCFFHEKDRDELRKALEAQLEEPTIAMMIEKTNVITVTHVLQKSDVPFCIKANSPIWYGQNLNHYTDLCQPIMWDGKTMYEANDDKTKTIPAGFEIPKELIKRTGVWQFNYGYMFKTYERSVELLYWFDIAHALWWGFGWHKRVITAITPETAMREFIVMMKERVERCNKKMTLIDHPKHIQPRLRSLGKEHFGYDFWGLIELPK